MGSPYCAAISVVGRWLVFSPLSDDFRALVFKANRAKQLLVYWLLYYNHSPQNPLLSTLTDHVLLAIAAIPRSLLWLEYLE